MNEHIIIFLTIFIIAFMLLSDTPDECIKHILMLSIVILLLHFFKNDNIEHMTSEEAIKNVASVFNSENMVVKNLKVTGNLEIGGNTTCNGNSTVNGTTNIIGNTTIGTTTKPVQISMYGNTVSSGSLNCTSIGTSGNIQVNGTATIGSDANIGQNINLTGSLTSQGMIRGKNVYANTIAGKLHHFDQDADGNRGCNLVYTLAATKPGDKMRWYAYDGGQFGTSTGGIWGTGNDIGIIKFGPGCTTK